MTMNTLKRVWDALWGRLRGEVGESSIGLVLLAPVVLLAGFGLTHDWAGKVQASEQAVTIAQQAARAGANAGAAGELGSSGKASKLNTAKASQAAQEFLNRSGAQGTVSVDPRQVRVSATVDYQPKFLPVGPLQGHGEGTAELRMHIRR
ncbi:hypothetical protein AB0O26_09855 [Micrococcus luteus]|uniref:hypothetical protein n=2 Tax=cellular organisms TaxID=131567 RepID=UPI003424D076|nr:hypothetical protein [Micrococcus luteus]